MRLPRRNKTGLGVTTPLTTGPHVEIAQHLLADAGHYHGALIGEFTPEVERATQDAKRALGHHPKRGHIFDEPLARQLAGTHNPYTPAALTRKLRARKTRNAAPLRIKALDRALSHVGDTEDPPDSNKCRYSRWYGITGPWCAMFVTYVYAKAGSKAFKRGQRWCSCPRMLAAARAGNGLRVITETEALPGDILLYSWNRSGVPEHTGLLKHKHADGGLNTVEGNTGDQSNNNGGEVEERSDRHTSDVVAYIRVTE